MFKRLIDLYLTHLQSWGYKGIVALMAMESSVIPLPSEVVIPPAAHLAHTGQGPFTIWGIIIAGTIGSWLGATIMYWVARLAGRPFILKYGTVAMISPQKVQGAENWAAHYGSMGIFISRLLPVVRHLIGIPAGIVRMNFALYSLFTILGSGIWCGVLCYLGIKMGQDEQLLKGELHRWTLWIGGVVLVLGSIYYFFVHRHLRGKKP